MCTAAFQHSACSEHTTLHTISDPVKKQLHFPGESPQACIHGSIYLPINLTCFGSLDGTSLNQLIVAPGSSPRQLRRFKLRAFWRYRRKRILWSEPCRRFTLKPGRSEIQPSSRTETCLFFVCCCCCFKFLFIWQQTADFLLSSCHHKNKVPPIGAD